MKVRKKSMFILYIVKYKNSNKSNESDKSERNQGKNDNKRKILKPSNAKRVKIIPIQQNETKTRAKRFTPFHKSDIGDLCNFVYTFR